VTALYSISPLYEENARVITTWRYPEPYDLYDLNADDLSGFLNPEYRYHQVLDRNGSLIGYCCFGLDARVPGGKYPQNEPEYLDIGVGMKPSYTGQGRGADFVRAILDYGAEGYQPEMFRVTIASFNQRSLKTFQRLGFKIQSSFEREMIQIQFFQLERPVMEENYG